MSGTPTVLSTHGASIPSSGFYTAQAISQVQALLNNAAAVVEVYGQNGVPPIPAVPPGEAGDYVLVVPNGVTVPSTLSLPDGYGAVVLGTGTDVTLTGGGANTTVLSAGALDYTGAAGSVADSGGSGTVDDSAAGAIVALGGGAFSVTMAGNQQAVNVDDGGSASVVSTGIGDVYAFGDPTTSGALQAAIDDATVPSNVLDLAATSQNSLVNLLSNNNVVYDNGFGSSTINGIGGAATVFAANNDVYYGGAASLLFIGAGSSQTVFGGTGNNTVFGNTAADKIVDNLSSGFNIFVAEASAATVFGAGTGAVFGGTGSTELILGNGNDVFVGGGGTDTVYGGNTTPTVFGGTNENLNIVGSHAAFEVALGDNDVMNASLSDGGNNFFALSSDGNTTLIGAAGGTEDNFVMVSTAGGTAHTVTIENWHNGDGLFLANYGAADIARMDNALNGGAASFTLSDGTTITFQGNHPTHGVGSVGF
jgi:hypothetical protein